MTHDDRKRDLWECNTRKALRWNAPIVLSLGVLLLISVSIDVMRGRIQWATAFVLFVGLLAVASGCAMSRSPEPRYAHAMPRRRGSRINDALCAVVALLLIVVGSLAGANGWGRLGGVLVASGGVSLVLLTRDRIR